MQTWQRSAEMLSWLLRPSPWKTAALRASSIKLLFSDRGSWKIQLHTPDIKKTQLECAESTPNAAIPSVLQQISMYTDGFPSVSFFSSVHLCFHPLCLWFHLNECHRRHRPGELLHFASPSTATNPAASGAPSQPIRAQESADRQRLRV